MRYAMQYPDATISLIGLLLLLFAGLPGSAFAGGNIWSSNGPQGGSAYALAIVLLTPTTVYAGAAGAGVFKSTDGGGGWRPSPTPPDQPRRPRPAIDPKTPATLYAATADQGVFKSADGSDWSAVNTGLTHTNVAALAIHPTTPRRPSTRRRRAAASSRRRTPGRTGAPSTAASTQRGRLPGD